MAEIEIDFDLPSDGISLSFIYSPDGGDEGGEKMVLNTCYWDDESMEDLDEYETASLMDKYSEMFKEQCRMYYGFRQEDDAYAEENGIEEDKWSELDSIFPEPFEE